MPVLAPPINPQPGMAAAVRNRRGIITSVQRHGQPVLNWVEVAYNDGEWPVSEALLWEREPAARLLAPGALPDPLAGAPMPRADLDALVRSCRWSARTPYIAPGKLAADGVQPVTAPFHGAVQIEDYQLVPLLKALRMPRVCLLIGDDVGLGKTVEAGLILAELILRRRIRRVLILTPASLRGQWRDEMLGKFALPFEIVDRDSTTRLRRQLGMDANPWRSHSRIIASYHYLKQPDVLQEFMAASTQEATGAHLPWDLLIVDEAHNLTPVPFGEESDLCAMLRQVAPQFEHRIFASATPHNGHTRSFTGLLEMLDPVRFSQTDELKPAERDRVRDVLVRRLKREINERSNPKRFSNRLEPQAQLLNPGSAEQEVSHAFAAFRAALRKQIQAASRQRRNAGAFAIEILGKRLLSCPATFAASWRRCKAGLAEEAADEAAVQAAKRSVQEDPADDREQESRAGVAAGTVGAWLKPFHPHLGREFDRLDRALEAIGLDPRPDGVSTTPSHDARFDALVRLIEQYLRAGKAWRDDERLVIFTEYKTTLDYLLDRLRARWPGEPDRFRCLFGGMDDPERDDVKRAFNDPGSLVRVLVATDAASEGLNLQESARYLLHYDVPWVPSRLEQRVGRLDRHGQARDVQTWHFVAPSDADLVFLDMLVRKVNTIREDLGATGDVFDEATCRKLIEGEDVETVRADLDRNVEAARKRADVPRDDSAAPADSDPAAARATQLQAIAEELDLSPSTLHETLESAMAIGFGRPRLTPPDPARFCDLIMPVPATWGPVVDDSVRIPLKSGVPGPIPHLAFDADAFVLRLNGRPVFRTRPDALLLHLAHPLFQKALALLTRQRFPGAHDNPASRWSVRPADLPADCEAVFLVHAEELAVNGLRENIHHWVRSWALPVRNGKLADPFPHQPAAQAWFPISELRTPISDSVVSLARDLWTDHEHAVQAFLKSTTRDLGRQVSERIAQDGELAIEDENKRYQSRQGELSTLIESNTLKRLESEIAALRLKRQQGLLFEQQAAFDAIDREVEQREQEIRRRGDHLKQLRDQLARERERIVKELLPLRYRLEGETHVMPVAVEILLPWGAA